MAEIAKKTNDTAQDPFGRTYERFVKGLWRDNKGNVYEVSETRGTIVLGKRVGVVYVGGAMDGLWKTKEPAAS